MANRIWYDPHQGEITRELIAEMVRWTPRRYKLSSWKDPINEGGDGRDPSLTLPFCETFRNCFLLMCNVRTIGVRESDSHRCYTFLKGDTEGTSLKQMEEWVEKVGASVALRDLLMISFALDFDRADGNPENPQTEIGLLRSRAKPYDGPPTNDTYAAADQIVARLVAFLEVMDCYDGIDAIVAMPPSRPDKPFDLPRYLADKLSAALEVEDLSDAVRTIRPRAPMKNCSVTEKLNNLDGTLEVDPLAGKILLLDDLYQSGVSLNYVAMELLAAGATEIYGLCIEKTCRNDDNTPRA